MRKIFKKSIAAVASTTMAVTLVAGLGTAGTGDVQAADTAVQLNPWVFYQAGDMASAAGMGLYDSVSTTAGTTLDSSNFPQAGERSVATQDVADGFTANIKTNGWDKVWDEDQCNPWMIAVRMNAIKMEKGHDYTITFKASASKGKYGYFTVGSEFEGEPKLQDQDALLVLNTTEQAYTFKFTNWAGATTLNVQFMLGAFAGSKDYAGNTITDKMVYGTETNWNGTVTVSDFKIVDNGENPDYIDPNPPTTANTQNNTSGNKQEETTKAPAVTSQQPTVAPTASVSKPGKVTVKSAKNVKGKKIKITWKKVKTATKYQVKVGTKKKTTKKLTYTMKSLKKNKTYKVYVRAYNKAGYGKWSKVKKVKVTK